MRQLLFWMIKLLKNPKGEDEVVWAHDSQMRFLLFPMLLQSVDE